MSENGDSQTASEIRAGEIAVNVFASPGEAFRAIKLEPKFWLALILLTVSTAAVQYIYLQGVDVGWLAQQATAANPRPTEAQAEQAAEFVANLPSFVIATFGALAGAVVTTLVFLLNALYFRIVSAIMKDGLGYRHCLGLVCWSSLPTLLGSLASIVNLLTNDISLMPTQEINPLAFWAYLGLEPLGRGAMDQIVMNTDPTTIWALILLILGYKTLTGRSVSTAIPVAVLPTAIIFGLAFAF
jgi:hypothetical protein